MSFSENPYKHVSFVIREDGAHLECSSCGRVGDAHPLSTPILDLIAEQRGHVMRSHERTEADFANWS